MGFIKPFRHLESMENKEMTYMNFYCLISQKVI